VERAEGGPAGDTVYAEVVRALEAHDGRAGLRAEDAVSANAEVALQVRHRGAQSGVQQSGVRRT